MIETDLIDIYKPISVKNNRLYKSNNKTEKIPLFNPINLSPLLESLLNPFDLIDSKYFNISHYQKQAPLVLNINNETFTVYSVLHHIINNCNVETIYYNPKHQNLKNLELENISFEPLENSPQNNIIISNKLITNKKMIYCIDIDECQNPLFWKNKNGSTIVLRINPEQHSPQLLNILDKILELSNHSYIEIPVNHSDVYYVVAIHIHHNFHQLYDSLKSCNNNNPINTIFAKTIHDMNSINKRKQKYIDYQWTEEASEYIMALNINYCYSICQKYQLQINNLYLNQFNQLKEIKLKHSKYITKYFPIEDNINHKELQISNVGLYSISKPFVTGTICDIIKNKVKSKLNKDLDQVTITDGTGGVGGDAIMFTRYFKLTNIVEIVKEHYDIIINNLNTYNRTNYKIYNDNYVNIYNQLKQDVIYLDSPWGGVGYKEHKYAELSLFDSNVTFNNFVDTLSKHNEKFLIFIKCPINYNIFQLSKNMANVKGNIEIFKVTNFLLLCLSI